LAAVEKQAYIGAARWWVRLLTRIRRDFPLAILDAVVLVPLYLIPLMVRFEAPIGRVPTPSRANYLLNFRSFIFVIIAIHLLTNFSCGLYGQMWRFASVREARRVVVAAGIGGVLVIFADIVMGLWPYGHRPLPLLVVGVGACLAVMGFGLIRFYGRLFAFKRREVVETPARILVVGAGEAGSLVLRDIMRSPDCGLRPIGIIDDNPKKIGRALGGVPILGGRSSLPDLLGKLDIDQVLLAVPSATSELVRDVAGACEKEDVRLRVLPSVNEVVNGTVTVRDIRDLSIEDILGRQQVDTDLVAVAAMLRGRRVLITGAGGSIGSEIARQVMQFEPAHLLLLDHDETHLHDVRADLDGARGVDTVLADIRDQGRILHIFQSFSPEVVFHAAAHKHVPILETYPEEALATNIIGTANLADAAVESKVSRFVLISTDKAVNPVSVMGTSKWFTEQIVRSLRPSSSAFCAVRFGNVLGSRGSVIPTFLKQIQHGGPVTVTDPSMARYFMSVQEAVQLVLQAAALAKGGEVFTLDMGEPMNILELAKKLIRLSGRVPGRDIPVEVIGPRPGEKMVEEIVGAEEERLPTSHPEISVSYPPELGRASLRRAMWELEAVASHGTRQELATAMKDLANQNWLDGSAAAGGAR